MSPAIKTIIYPVKDLAASKVLFTALAGEKPVVDEGYYVQFNVGEQELGLDPNGHAKGMTGPVAYWQVEDINSCVKQLLADGATELEAVTDFGGRLVATVTDADGNVVGLTQLP